MAISTAYPLPISLRLLAAWRRFIHRLTTPRVILGLLMLVSMVYLILAPLYRMLETTFTVQDRDIHHIPDAVPGEFTLFHWIRMLTEPISEVMTYAPLQHSLVVSIGATLLALLIGSALAWLIVRADIAGGNIINMLACQPGKI